MGINRHQWIDEFCEALARAFEDHALPSDAHNALSDAMDSITQTYLENSPSGDARTLLPLALKRAILAVTAQGATPPPAQREALDVQNVVRAERFELVDDKGKVRAELFTRRGIADEANLRTVFSMRGKGRQDLQMVSDDETGEMAIRILEAGEFYPISFGVNLYPGHPEPMLEIGGSDEVGSSYMRLKLDGDNAEPAIRLYDRNDVVRAMLKLSKDGTAIFEPFDAEANEIQGSDGTGVLIARLLEDESLPEEIRDAIFNAAEKIMNELNEGDEMTVAWTKLYLDEALKRRREEETDDEG
jgi:uncharacterized protein (UPF0147 family)